MASTHTDLIKRHRQLLRSRLRKLNEREGTQYRLGQKNIDVLFYLNYIKFLNKLAANSAKIATLEGSSEVLPQHWSESGNLLLEEYKNNGMLH